MSAAFDPVHAGATPSTRPRPSHSRPGLDGGWGFSPCGDDGENAAAPVSSLTLDRSAAVVLVIQAAASGKGTPTKLHMCSKRPGEPGATRS
jgi:hypothetical protein